MIVGAFSLNCFDSQHKIARPWFLIVVVGIMGASYVMLAFIDTPNMLLLASITIGFGYGGLFVVCPALISLFFGLRYFGQNWGTTVFFPMVSLFTFNLATSLLYDAQAGAEHQCNGENCFRWAFIICAAGCGLSMLLGLLLVRKTKHFFTRLQKKIALDLEKRKDPTMQLRTRGYVEQRDEEERLPTNDETL